MNIAYTNNGCKMASDEGRKKSGKVGFQNLYTRPVDKTSEIRNSKTLTTLIPQKLEIRGPEP